MGQWWIGYIKQGLNYPLPGGRGWEGARERGMSAGRGALHDLVTGREEGWSALALSTLQASTPREREREGREREREGEGEREREREREERERRKEQPPTLKVPLLKKKDMPEYETHISGKRQRKYCASLKGPAVLFFLWEHFNFLGWTTIN